MKKHILAEAHRRQFNGEDWQKVAVDLAEEFNIDYDSDDYTELCSTPDPSCECGFCEKAPWRD
jgi:hypothetical protein